MQFNYTPFLEKTITDWVGSQTTFQEKEKVTQHILQVTLETLLKAEREDFLKNNHCDSNKANGYYTRMAKILAGTFTLKIPRDRMNIFQPLLLDIIKTEQNDINELAFSLYAKGMTTRDINSILEKVYDLKTSPQYISNITNTFLKLRKEWECKKLDSQYHCVYIDALHINIRRDTVDNEAIYVVLGLKTDFTREILGIYSIPEESASGWGLVLEDIKKRGVKDVSLFVADGITGLENKIHKIFPKSFFQKCIVHLKRNILLKTRSKDKKEMSNDLKSVFDIGNPKDTTNQAKERLDVFIAKWRKQYPQLMKNLEKETIQYYFTYLNFPHQIQSMIYTTNWIERLNKSIRKVTKNKNSFPSEDSALTLIWQAVLNIEEKTYSKYPITSFYQVKEELQKIFN